MTSSFAATLLISLRRARAAWPIVLAAGLTCLLASSLLAAGPMYASAVSVAGLHRVLTDAPVGDANIEVSMRVAPDRADEVDGLVTAALDEALQGVGGPVVRFGRSDTFALPIDLGGAATDLVELASAEDLEQHGTLVDGAWPRDRATGAIDVVLTDGVASSLGLRVGDSLSLASRLDPSFLVPIRVSGIFRIDDPNEPYWWGDPQVLDGVVSSDTFSTHGPFFTTRRSLLGRATLDRAPLTWRAFPVVADLSLDETGRLRARAAGLDQRIETATGGIPTTVQTDLPAILAEAERSLLVSRTGVLLLIVQLAVLAAYAVLLSAALLVDHRRMDTAMLRSRGAGPARIGVLALVEGLLLTVPAALLGPWVALAALGLFDVIGPLTTIGLHIDPTVSIEAYVASTLAAAGCLVALVLPALPTRRSFAAVRSGLSRAGTMTAGQRSGLDIALLVVAAIGVWQLRHYGAPLTRTVQGAVGIDPLLVATPAIGLLAGAVVALRLLPLLARAIERATARRRGLVSSLGARQLARRPLRYTRAALLLMLAMAMGVFAVAYTWTWTTSQRDQAGYQVGADVSVVPGTRTGTPPRWALDRAYATIDGIAARTPVGRAPLQAARGASGSIVALDAVAAPSVVTLRPDLASMPIADLMAPLATARPTLDAPALPDGTRQVRLGVTTAVREAIQVGIDPATGDPTTTAVDPAEAAARGTVTPAVVVRDATGQLYRSTGTPVALGGRHDITIDLAAGGTPDDAFSDPLELVAVELRVSVPPDLHLVDGALGVDAVAAASADGAWTDVPLELPGGWRVTSAVQEGIHDVVGGGSGGTATLSAAIGAPGLLEIGGGDGTGRGTTVSFAPATIDDIAAAPIHAVATDAYLAASGRHVGELVPVDVGGVRRSVSIGATVRGFPTVAPDVPALVVDLPTFALVRFAGSDATDPVREWWLAVDDARQAEVAARLVARPFDSRTVTTSVGRELALATDPVALGIIGALAIGFAAAALFAVVGFVVSAAVSARERVGEFALLRAIGLSSTQLSGWLSLENAVLATVSLVCGTALGLLMAWIVLPFVTVTQAGATPYPPVDVVVPWTTIAILEAVAILTLAATVAGLAWLLRRIGLAAVLRTGEE